MHLGGELPALLCVSSLGVGVTLFQILILAPEFVLFLSDLLWLARINVL